MVVDAMGNGVEKISNSVADFKENSGYFKNPGGDNKSGNYMHDKLSGNT